MSVSTPDGAVVVVGANLAGGRAAEALRAEGFEGRIVLVGEEEHPPYERPPLSKEVLLGQQIAADTYLRPIEGWAALDVDLRLGTRVEKLLASSGQVQLSGGVCEPADRVLLCTGGRVRRLHLPGSDLGGVHYLRDIESAYALRDALCAGTSVVVVGGGFMGCEVAAAARTLGCDVTMLEEMPVLLGRIGGPAGAVVERLHREHGVRVITGAAVRELVGDRRVQAVVTSAGERIEADVVVVGVGIEPAVELAADAGIRVANGIVVDEHCMTSNPAIYAAGDVTWHPNAIVGHEVRLEHWANAQNQAVSAARSILGRPERYATVPWFWSDQYGIRIEMAGLPTAADSITWRGEPGEVGASAFFLGGGVVVGAMSFGRPRDVRAAMALIEKKLAVDPELLADETTDLRRLTPRTLPSP